MTTATTSPGNEAQAAHDDHHHDHPSYLAHHFETAEQQFDAGKLGIWIFLVTEVLFFSGLFVAYTIYRVNHPEIFKYSHQFLNKYLGGINTGVLIFSSLTMAWAVRAAQLGQHRLQIIMLSITLFCAAMFLGVKSFEYTEKFHKHLLWAGASVSPAEVGKAWQLFKFSDAKPVGTWEARTEVTMYQMLRFWWVVGLVPLVMASYGHWMNVRWLRSVGVCGLLSIFGVIIGVYTGLIFHAFEHSGGGHGAVAAHGTADPHADTHAPVAHAADAHTADAHAPAAASGDAHAKDDHSKPAEHAPVVKDDSIYAPSKNLNEASTANVEAAEVSPPINASTAAPDVVHEAHDHGPMPRHANLFFSIYYFMTGLHAFHIIAGMIAISWLICRAFNNEFHEAYFGPVDYVGLYWHLVDLIWIYLFPLLYLIK